MGKVKPTLPKIILEELFRPPPALFKLALHAFIYFIILILGFRVSREALPILKQAPEATFIAKSTNGSTRNEELQIPRMNSNSPPSNNKSSRVHVGRHEILVRPWPHPKPLQTMMAHKLLEIVQKMQKDVYGVKERRQLIVITPIYLHALQEIYITSLIHTLKLVPGPLIWIVIEDGAKSIETAAILTASGLSFLHLSFADRLHSGSELQEELKTSLRVEGLRFVRDHHLDGIVIFADDSINYDLEFFDEVQRVQWIGVASLGLLSEPDIIDALKNDSRMEKGKFTTDKEMVQEATQQFPIHGPVCNSTQHLIGWHMPYVKSGQLQGSINGNPKSQQSIRTLDWASFVLNAQVLWKDAEGPPWILKWDHWVQGSQVGLSSPLGLVKGMRFLEPLGNCGRKVWLWRLLGEAPTGNNFPHRWEIETPLDIIPSRCTPWQNKPVISSLPPAVSTSIGMGKQTYEGNSVR